jgi:two-component system, sensor histidine kinase LadS
MIGKILQSLILIYIILFSSSFCKNDDSSKNVPSFSLDPKQFFLYAKDSTFILEDKKSKYNFQDILELEEETWTPSQGKASLGIYSGTLWLKLDIENPTIERDWILQMDSPNLEIVTLYKINQSSEWESLQSGRNVSSSNMILPSRIPIFPIHISQGTTQRIYLKIRVNSTALFPIRFFTKYEYESFSSIMSFLSGMYYGGMILLLAYNLALYFSTRDRVFLTYCIYLLFFTSFIFFSNNQWKPWLDFGTDRKINMLIPILSLFTTIFASIFTLTFLYKENEKSRMKSIIKIMIFIFIISVPVLFLFTLADAVTIANIIPLLGTVIVLTAGIIRWKENYIPARYFLLAWTFLIFAVFFYIMMNLGFLEYNTLFSYSPMYGSIVEGILLSLGIGNRMNEMKLEAEESRREIVKIQEKSIFEQKEINKSISRFVPSPFLEILDKESILEVERGDSKEENLSILFTDIRNFTKMSEDKSAREIFLMLNEYLEKVTPCILSNNGFIDKYIGDAIMALFPGSPDDAIKAAIAMRLALQEFNSTLESEDRIDTGIGIHFGTVMLGTLGSSNRLDTTVIGDSVNLASRVEGLTKVYSVPLLVTDDVIKHSLNQEEFLYREIDSVFVKGKTKPIVIYEILNTDPEDICDSKMNSYSIFFEGMQELRNKNSKSALEKFEECIRLSPKDTVAKYYYNLAKQENS